MPKDALSGAAGQGVLCGGVWFAAEEKSMGSLLLQTNVHRMEHTENGKKKNGEIR